MKKYPFLKSPFRMGQRKTQKQGGAMLFEKHRLIPLPPATFPQFVLNKIDCNGCGRCVQTCPIQILMIEDQKVTPNERYDAFRCIACQNCMAVCPNGAITIQGNYRVGEGFWKNAHLYSDNETFPEPLPQHTGKPFEEYENELTETEKVIFKRRSVRLYKKKQVPQELVKRVIEAGRFAPSAGNNQPWKFVVIQNRQLINQINEKCKSFIKLVTAATLPKPWLKKQIPGDKNAKLSKWQKMVLQILVRWRPGDIDPRARGGMNAVTSDPDYDIFLGAPTLILILADKRGIGSIDLDTGICAQNMILAAHSLGLGTCYIGLIDGLQLYPKFQEKLGVTPPFEIVTSFTLGFPQGQVDNVVKREEARIVWFE